MIPLMGSRQMLWGFAAISFAALAAVFTLQYAFGEEPCHLCLLERWPYAAALAAATAGALMHRPRPRRAIVTLCTLLFLGGAAIAFYHTGVEYHFFPGPSSCTSRPPANDSIEALREQIANAPLIACDVPAMRVFGISLAGWNALLSFSLAAAGFIFLARSRRA